MCGCECLFAWTVCVWILTCSSFANDLSHDSLCSCASTSTVLRLYTLPSTHTLTLTHSCLTCYKPWISWAALKIKFLSQIIFLVIKKYTCSQRERNVQMPWQPDDSSLPPPLFLSSPAILSSVLCFYPTLFFCSFLLIYFVDSSTIGWWSYKPSTTFAMYMTFYLTKFLYFLFVPCSHLLFFLNW